MISYIEGKILIKELTYIIIENQGIGYKVFIGFETYETIGNEGKKVKLFCFQNIREDALDLYGFLDYNQLKFFELLLTVQGVGPKVAVAIINRLNAEKVKEAIIQNDATLITTVPGVGPKVANRIILELKGKISPDDLSVLSTTGEYGETLDALVSLGYKANEVKIILQKMPKNIKDSGGKVKWALREMGK